MRRTRPSFISLARPNSATPELLATITRSRAPCSIRPSISWLGCPTAPNPPTRTVAPSATPSSAAATLATRLSIIVFRYASRDRGSMYPGPAMGNRPSTDEVAGLPAGQHGVDAVQHHRPHRVARGGGGAAQMRQQHRVLHREVVRGSAPARPRTRPARPRRRGRCAARRSGRRRPPGCRGRHWPPRRRGGSLAMRSAFSQCMVPAPPGAFSDSSSLAARKLSSSSW